MKKICSVIILIAMLQIITGALNHHENILNNFMNAPKKELFKAFHAVFNKDYELNSEEGVRKYYAFKDNLNFIKETNSKNLGYTLGLTQFADMTNEEYREKVLINSAIFEKQMSEVSRLSSIYESEGSYTQGTTKVDYIPNFGPPKNQGICGSCWAFCTTGAIEGGYNFNFKESLDLSNQHLIDCDNIDNGCNGGWPTNAFNYIKSNGVMRESDYPYTSRSTNTKGTCTFSAAKALKIMTGYEECLIRSCKMATWTEMIKQGPLAVVVDAGMRDFQLYRSGVINPVKCGAANHGIIAVGIDNDGVSDIITIRNSWGITWGDKGNLKIRYNATTNTCKITSVAWLPLLQKAAPTPIPGPAPGPTPPPAPVTQCPKFHSDCSFKGSSLSTCNSLPNLPNSFVDLIKSVNIGTYGHVGLYEDSNCSGRSVSLQVSETCMTTSPIAAVKKMSGRSVSLTALKKEDLPKDDCIAVFTNSCYSGGRQEICDSIADLTSFNMNDKISSILIGQNVKNVVIFIDANYEGLSFGFTSSTANLHQGSTKIFNDQVSSIRIFK